MNETAEVTHINYDVIKFDITEAKIKEMAEKYLPLKINGLDDTTGYEIVDKARKKVVKKRTAVEKRRKDLKADALAWGRKVDSEANRIKELLEPIESHLKAEVDRIDAELDRIKAEEAAAEQARIQGMIDELQKYGSQLPVLAVATMSDDEYAKVLCSAKTAWELEQERLAEEKRKAEEQAEAEAAARKAEAEKLAAERAELDRMRKEQEERDRVEREKREAEQAAIRAEREALEAEKREIEMEAARKKAAEEARIQAEKDAKEKSEREAAAKAEAEKRRKEEAIRKEMMLPDKEKLQAFSQFLSESITYPNVSSPEADEIVQAAFKKIQEVSEYVLSASEAL